MCRKCVKSNSNVQLLYLGVRRRKPHNIRFCLNCTHIRSDFNVCFLTSLSRKPSIGQASEQSVHKLVFSANLYDDCYVLDSSQTQYATSCSSNYQVKRAKQLTFFKEKKREWHPLSAQHVRRSSARGHCKLPTSKTDVSTSRGVV